MIRLKRLTLQNFRSFVDRTVIDFPSNGLVLIRGHNSTSHDSSGAGKSSLLLAIAYALDMCPFAASELTSWNGTGSMQVELELEVRGQPVVISRGKKNSFEAAGEKVTGAKAVGESIRKLFGLDPETLQAITYRPQNTPGLFLTLTDAEKKEFLTRLLGLHKIEDAVEEAATKADIINMNLGSEQVLLKDGEQALSTLSGMTLAAPKDPGPLKQELTELQARHSDIDRQIAEVREIETKAKAGVEQDQALNQLQEYQKAAASQIQTAVEANTIRYNQFLERQEKLRKRLQEIARADQLKVSLADQIRQAQTQMAVAEQSKCPKCERTWDLAAEEVARLRGTIENFQAQISLLGNTGDRPNVEATLREQFVHDPVIEQLKALSERFRQQIVARREELTQGPSLIARERVQELSTQKQVLATRLAAVNQQLGMIDSFNAQTEKARADREASIKTMSAAVEARRKNVIEWTSDMNAEKDFVDLMGRDGFLGVIFDEVLREIEVEANERLGRLANVAHVTISFKTESETQKGTIQRKIVPVVHVNGVEAKLKTGLSGGMYTSVEQVVDLAVMAVVQRRTGALPGFLFLDESFNGQGAATKEAAMEVLREFAQDKLVLIIDHNSEFKEMFSQFIDVSYEDGKSSAK